MGAGATVGVAVGALAVWVVIMIVVGKLEARGYYKREARKASSTSVTDQT
jgi:hypothetical protein